MGGMAQQNLSTDAINRMCNRFINRLSLTEIVTFAGALGYDFAGDATLKGGEYFPDQDVPTLSRRGRSLCYSAARWGLPPIPGGKDPITNIRNLNSRWWTVENPDLTLDAAQRCLVPFSVFAEPTRNSRWFEPQTTAPMLACFAGFWQPWRGERLKTVPGAKRRMRRTDDWTLFGFLTTAANATVRPVHDAMPVILTKPDQMQAWLAGGAESFALQQPLAETLLKIVTVEAPISPVNGPDQGVLF